ncbi:MAG: histidine phosphatase family protein [Cyclobacteriaceae bacterium]|nr:histidine phosphatase family protein [Cyclobacteriaceae bacterium]
MIIFTNDFTRTSAKEIDQITKVVLVLRHAQSAGNQPGQPDYERSLTIVGRRQAQAVGKKLSQQKIYPDFILSSGARRTVETVNALNESLNLEADKINFKADLYNASVDDWTDNLRELADAHHTVIVVGHNPAISHLTTLLSGSSVELLPGELIGVSVAADRWNEIRFPGKEIIRYHAK